VIDKDFHINGKKRIQVKKIEEDLFIVFDSIDLNYYNINQVGADILYYLSKNRSLNQMIDLLVNEYEVERDECKESIIEFFEYFPLQNIVYSLLVATNIYLSLSPFSEYNSLKRENNS
jgi:hypothetical protein